MRKKICFIQPTYRDQSGALFKGNSIFIHSLALPILSATVPPDWEKEFRFEYFDDIDYGTDAAETFDQIYQFIRRARVNLPVLNLLLPAPGTRTFDRLDREGRLLVRTEDEFLRNNLSYNISCNRCFYVPKLMSAEGTARKFAELHGRLGSPWQVLRRSVTGNLLTFPILLAKNLELRRDARKMLAAVEGPPGRGASSLASGPHVVGP